MQCVQCVQTEQVPKSRAPALCCDTADQSNRIPSHCYKDAPDYNCAHVPVILARQVRTHADVAATCASAVLLHLFIALSATLRKGRDYTISSLAVHMLQSPLILAQLSQDTRVRQVKTRAAAMGLGCRYVQSQFHYNPKQPCNALILLRRLLLSAA